MYAVSWVCWVQTCGLAMPLDTSSEEAFVDLWWHNVATYISVHLVSDGSFRLLSIISCNIYHVVDLHHLMPFIAMDVIN